MTILAFIWIAGCIAGCSQPPALKSEEAFKTADALYTALTSRRMKLLDNVEQDLHNLKAEGKLPDAASQRLDAIIAMARSGKWQEAAEELDFVIRYQPPHQHRH